MKRTNKNTTWNYDRYEVYEEINILCGDDDDYCYAKYSKKYIRESGYDTYTGFSDDYDDWN